MQFESIAATSQMDSPLGLITLAATGHGLAGAWFEGQRHHPDTMTWPRDEHHRTLREAIRQLDQFFAGKRQQFDLELDLSGGTPFQQSVWRALLQIAPGGTCSYGAIGQCIGRSNANRAVGAAVGRNPISVIVPCHRVLGADGSLTGYAGGLARKVALLKLESGRAATPIPASTMRPGESVTIAA